MTPSTTKRVTDTLHGTAGRLRTAWSDALYNVYRTVLDEMHDADAEPTP